MTYATIKLWLHEPSGELDIVQPDGLIWRMNSYDEWYSFELDWATPTHDEIPAWVLIGEL